MAKLTDEIKERIIADYNVGKSQNWLAKKYELSPATINKLCKGIVRKALPPNRGIISTPDPCFVYIVTAKEFECIYKIGMTNSIESRIAAMQTGCPYFLYALKFYKVANPVAVESMLHAFFHKKRIRGEWFRLNEVDLQYIDDAMCTIDEVVYG